MSVELNLNSLELSNQLREASIIITNRSPLPWVASGASECHSTVKDGWQGSVWPVMYEIQVIRFKKMFFKGLM